MSKVGSPPEEGLNSQLTLEGTGILLNSSSCYVYAKNFKLLPHSLGKTTISLRRTRITLPAVDTMLTFSEGTVLQSQTSLPVDLRRLNEISTRVASRSRMRGGEVHRIVSVLRDADRNQHTLSWSWVIAIMIITLIIVTLWPIWFKLFKFCYKNIRTYVQFPTQLQTVAANKEPNDDGTKLQVNERNRQRRRCQGLHWTLFLKYSPLHLPHS